MYTWGTANPPLRREFGSTVISLFFPCPPAALEQRAVTASRALLP